MPGENREEHGNGEKKAKTVVFLHPDLGIGGAERLVVDAAVGLQKRGHRVVIYTSHCDPAHCFEEARDGKLPAQPKGFEGLEKPLPLYSLTIGGCSFIFSSSRNP